MPDNPDSEARILMRTALRELGDVIRATRAPELGWLGDTRSSWPDAPAEILGLKDRFEQAEQGAAPTTQVIWAKPSPAAIDRADRLLPHLMALTHPHRLIASGYATRAGMSRLAKHLHISKRQAWYILGEACDMLKKRLHTKPRRNRIPN